MPPPNITSSIPPSISFPAHLQQISTQFNTISIGAPPNVTTVHPSQPSTQFNSNFHNGFGGNNPMGNTNIRVPMHQMNITQQTTAAPPTLGNNLLSFNNSNNGAMMSSSSWNNSKKNGSTDKAVALSAQEINDFLS